MNYGYWAEVAAKQKVPTEGWEVYKYECIRDTDAFKLTGAVPTLKNGKKSFVGCPKTVVILTMPELQNLAREYELLSGLCADCRGRRTEVWKISVTEGTTYRDCSACKGTGKAHGKS